MRSGATRSLFTAKNVGIKGLTAGRFVWLPRTNTITRYRAPRGWVKVAKDRAASETETERTTGEKERSSEHRKQSERGKETRVERGSVVLISHIGQPWQRQPEPSTRPI